MNRDELNKLHQIVMGQFYSENLLKKAIAYARSKGNLEAKVLLTSLKNGLTSTAAFFTLQDWIISETNTLKGN